MLGSFKTLKTSLALDLAIALASGTPFLGRFPVAETGRVLFLAGDAGLPALQAKARRICTARGLSLAALDNLVISPHVPRLDSPFDMMALEELLLVQKPLLLVIDPADLALGGKSRGKGDPADVRQMLGELTRLADAVGCTVLIVQHSKPPRRTGDPATLDELAGNGLAECAGQWLLVSRRRPFAVGGGPHELWLTTGNRLGDQGLWEIDVDETLATDEKSTTGANATPLADDRAGGHVVRHAGRRAVGGGERRSASASPGADVRAAVSANARNVDGVPRRLHVPQLAGHAGHERRPHQPRARRPDRAGRRRENGGHHHRPPPAEDHLQPRASLRPVGRGTQVATGEARSESLRRGDRPIRRTPGPVALPELRANPP